MRPLDLVRALRPEQWSKNVFVLAAAGFAWGDDTLADPLDQEDLLRTLAAFAAFCFGSSAVYLWNDLRDAEADRAHPEKRHRPIAAGRVRPATAHVTALISAALALALAWIAGGPGPSVALVVGGYVAMNLAYSAGLKRVVLVDVFCIALGFLLRVVAGGMAAGAAVSHWLLLCTLFLALFLALNKRRAEIVMLGAGGASHRASLAHYTVGFLDQMVTALAAATIVSYALYTVDDETTRKFGADNHLVWSVPFVVFGLARYMLLVQTEQGGANPTRVFLGGDFLFLANSLAWLAVVASAIA